MCWICLKEIPEGQYTRDHIEPRSSRDKLEFREQTYTKGRSVEWKPACYLCNHARGNLAAEEVVRIQEKLTNKLGDWWQPIDIRIELEHLRYPKRKIKIQNWYEKAWMKDRGPNIQKPTGDLSWVEKYRVKKIEE